MRLFSSTPVSPAVTPLPKAEFSDWMAETTFPEIGGVAFPHGAHRQGGGALRVDQRGLRRRMLGREQPAQRDVGAARIGAMGFAVEEGTLLHLHHQVDQRRAVPAEPGEVEVLQDAQHLQEGEAGGIRRGLAQGEAAVGHADRRRAAGEIDLGDQPAGGSDAGGEAPGQRTLVEPRRTFGGNGCQRLRQLRLHH
jgi:hypothetical protein